ncbi:hypothetical protein VPH35_020783 [Triticum aestivum]
MSILVCHFITSSVRHGHRLSIHATSPRPVHNHHPCLFTATIPVRSPVQDVDAEHAALPDHGSLSPLRDPGPTGSPERVSPGRLLVGSAASVSSTVVASPPCLLPQPLSSSSDLHQENMVAFSK